MQTRKKNDKGSTLPKCAFVLIVSILRDFSFHFCLDCAFSVV